MASVTRSSRRAEGQTHHFTSPAMRSRPASLNQAAATGGGGGGGGGRTKRALEPANDHDYDMVTSKKARLSVGILGDPYARNNNAVNTQPKPSPPSKQTSAGAGPVNAAGVTAPPRRSGGAASRPPAPAAPAPAAPAPTGTAAATAPPPPVTATAPATRENDQQNTARQRSKASNGIKHELDRLHPQEEVKREYGRKLRSQEATRFKSELSAYFPDYDEVIGNDPKEEYLLNPDTPIIVADSSKQRGSAPTPQPTVRRPTQDTGTSSVRGYGDALYTDVVDAQRIDFSFLEAQHKNKALEDPLPDTLFHPVHKRAERNERSIRNTEKGRAQHEKDQIIRLLEGLQGHDWLRVMGVSGVTETKKKTFEPARQYFISGCEGILEKFRNWNLEEKRRKLEKERALAEKAEEDEEQDEVGTKSASEAVEDEEEEDDGEGDDEDEEDGGSSDNNTGREEILASDESSMGDTSEASSPAKQLREEALARSRLAAKAAKKPPQPPAPPREFKSFFSKRGERDGAVNRTRRSGRKVLAWGHPIPEMPEADFELPEEYRDEETMKARARKKRRDKRGSKV